MFSGLVKTSSVLYLKDGCLSCYTSIWPMIFAQLLAWMSLDSVQKFEFNLISIKFDRSCTYGYTGHQLPQVS